MKNKNKNKKLNLNENLFLLIVKMAIGTTISWELAHFTGSNHPYLAPISVILCLQSTVDQTIKLSLNRIIGTIIGISFTVLFVSQFGLNGWSLGLLILVGSSIARLLNFDQLVLHQVALTILLVFVFEHKTEHYALDRIRDTIIGIIVAILIHLLFFPPNFTKQAGKTIQEFSNCLSESFAATAEWVKGSGNQNDDFQIEEKEKELLHRLHYTKEIVNKASQSLKFRPFAGKYRLKLQLYEKKVTRLSRGYSVLSEVKLIVKDWSAAQTITALDREAWANQLKVLSGYFREGETNNPSNSKVKGENLLQIDIPVEMKNKRFESALYQVIHRFVKEI
jgi:uncharacterized membrane protein YgaE (UPF0421/DUF939 family)